MTDFMVSRIGLFSMLLLMVDPFGPTRDTMISNEADTRIRMKTALSKPYSRAGDGSVDTQCKIGGHSLKLCVPNLISFRDDDPKEVDQVELQMGKVAPIDVKVSNFLF